MAVDVYTTSEIITSPRISFSHDLNDPSSEFHFNFNPTDPTRPDPVLLSPPSFDFNFRTTSNLTPADELFSNGKILPTQIKRSDFVQNPETKSKSNNPKFDSQKKKLKEFILDQDPDQDPGHDPNHDPNQEPDKSILKSFWQFRRSASLNCDGSNKGSKGLLRSLSIKSLSRSYSTGSGLNPKLNSGQNSGQKGIEKSKDPMLLRRCASLNQQPPQHVYYSYYNSNNAKSCNKGGVKIIPILNVPPAYSISKGSVNFFGFGFFCNGKVKKKSKS